MLILDLRLTLFALLLALCLTAVLGAWLARRQRRALPDSIEDAPFGYLRLRRGGRYTSANAYARCLFDLDPAGALPDALWVDLLDEDWTLARGAGATAAGRFRRAALSEQQAVAWWLAPNGGEAAVFLLDVTEDFELREGGRRLLNDLAHELRTPLATLLTHAEVLHLPNLAQAARDQSMDLIRAEGRRMSRLLTLMLELGRLEVGRDLLLRPLDLGAAAVETVAQMQGALLAHGLTVSVETDDRLPLVNGDGDRLRQVLLNLLDNTVKHCRPGDAVRVSVRGEDGGVRCTVSDTGPGIPPQHLPHLTQRFYRAAPQAVEGSGLGLALVGEVLRRHGSQLEVESRTAAGASGTCFSFLLPAIGGEGSQ